MSWDTFKVKASLDFTVSLDYDKKPTLNVQVGNLHVDSTSYDMNSYAGLADMIQDFDYRQENVEGIELDKLSDEMEYEADAELEITNSSSYDAWSGATEYDVDVFISVKSYKELQKLTDGCASESFDPYEKVFSYSTNNDGDFLKIRYLSSKKLLIHVGHCCVSRKMIIHPMTLTKLIADYELKNDEPPGTELPACGEIAEMREEEDE